ncbi:methionyl-tRNA formyltransferase [Paeniglutamicibacter gangotriensis]|uniref:Methionyl-tRNA formyltransferase n=2 Tax=Paeniglutamicibacter gangotriensis TaxID=254787 RepID=M7NEP8_9MICC|nr:methionyl-tRNA formyltransferase [Paeniglutamicibacter gangotriensis]EMQ96988.1 methionyl-tRNA formyltransferase [Paeniglutamicibacter gangotriensis Lz1y]KAA0979778.1 methionyl-tRNA formyltransferase [Paeniglutamicibacter gangotriensis]
MRVLFAGTPQVAVASLDQLVNDGFDVVAVLTREDAPIGRKRVMTPSPVAARAAELGIEIIHANRIDEVTQERIAALSADIAAIVAYGGLVPEKALGIPRLGWVNLHFSLLPAWRGAAPVQHSIMSGDDVTGAVTFQLEKGLDTGPVFGTLTEAIDPADTAGELLGRLAVSGSVLLSQTLSGLDTGALRGIPQQGEGSYAHKLTLVDGKIDWNAPALAIRRKINGTTPDPGAWTELEGQRFKIGPLLPATDVDGLAPGQVEITAGKQPRVVVGTGSHGVELVQVQPPGKKMMNAADWARGILASGTVEKVKFA